jgi:hypothetical protein
MKGPFVSHLEPTAVGELFREISHGYVGTDIYVDFSCGYGCLPMRLSVSEFTLKSSKGAGVPTIVAESRDRMSSFQYQYPSPIASRSSHADLVEKCGNYVRKHQQNMPIPTPWRRSEISKMVVAVVSRYHFSASSSRNVSWLILRSEIR